MPRVGLAMLENSNAVGALLETYTTAQTVICSEQNGKCFRPRSFHLVFAYIALQLIILL